MPLNGMLVTTPAATTPGCWLDGVDEPIGERDPRGAGPVRRAGQRDLPGQDVLRLEPRRHRERALQADAEQPRARQQDEGERDLRDEERVAHLLGGAVRRAAARFAGQHAGFMRTQAVPRDRDRQRDADRDRGEKRDPGDSGVERDLRPERQPSGAEHIEQADPGGARAEPEGRARQCEQHRIDHHLADNVTAARADRVAHGQLTKASARPDEQQVDEIDRADRQQDERAGLDEQQRRADRGDVIGAQRHDHRTEPGVGHHLRFGAVRAHGRVVRIDLRLRFGRRHAVRKTRDHLRQAARMPSRGTSSLGIGRTREVQTRAAGQEAEVRRQYADHRRLGAVNADAPADRVRIGAQPLAPVRVGQDHDVVGLEGRLLVGERAADYRTASERGEEVGRHAHHLLALGRPGVADDSGVFPIEGKRGEGRDAPAALVVVGDRRAIVHDAGARVGVEDANQPVGVGERQRAEQDGVDDREDGEVGAEAQRKRGQRRGREARRLAHQPEGMPQLLAQFVRGHKDQDDGMMPDVSGEQRHTHGLLRNATFPLAMRRQERHDALGIAGAGRTLDALMAAGHEPQRDTRRVRGRNQLRMTLRRVVILHAVDEQDWRAGLRDGSDRRCLSKVGTEPQPRVGERELDARTERNAAHPRPGPELLPGTVERDLAHVGKRRFSHHRAQLGRIRCLQRKRAAERLAERIDASARHTRHEPPSHRRRSPASRAPSVPAVPPLAPWARASTARAR